MTKSETRLVLNHQEIVDIIKRKINSNKQKSQKKRSCISFSIMPPCKNGFTLVINTIIVSREVRNTKKKCFSFLSRQRLSLFQVTKSRSNLSQVFHSVDLYHIERIQRKHLQQSASKKGLQNWFFPVIFARFSKQV